MEAMIEQAKEVKDVAEQAGGHAPVDMVKALYLSFQDHFFGRRDPPLSNLQLFGLQPSAQHIHTFTTRDGKVSRGDVAVHDAVGQAEALFDFIFESMPEAWYWTDGVEERGITNDELGNVRAVRRRFCLWFIYTRQSLLYQTMALRLKDPLLADDEEGNQISEQTLWGCFEALTPTEEARSRKTPFQKVLQYTERAFVVNKWVLGRNAVYRPKMVKPTRIVVDESNRRLCLHCGLPEEEHKFPPEFPSKDWGSHVFALKTAPPEGRKEVSTRSLVLLEYHNGQKIKDSSLTSTVQAVCCRGGSQTKKYEHLTSKTGEVAKQVSRFFHENSHVPGVPHLNCHRHAYSFQNGVLLLFDGPGTLPEFYPYVCDCAAGACACLAGRLPSKVKAQKYFDAYYDDDTVKQWIVDYEAECSVCHSRALDCDCAEGFHPIDVDYSKIETPFLRQLFKDQDIEGEAFDMMTMLLFARTLFKVNEIDKWQIFPHIRGAGGTGKSMICDLIKAMMEQSDVGFLTNNAQMKFVLGDLYDKRLVIGAEVDENMSLERTDLCSMVAGESMTVTRKGISSVTVPNWPSNVVLTGNTDIYTGKDKGSSVQRRRVVVDFPNGVREKDKDGCMADRLLVELPFILTRAVGMYLNFVRTPSATSPAPRGNQSFWSVCPKFFCDQKTKAFERANPICAFLSHCRNNEILVWREDAYIAVGDFMQLYKQWGEEMQTSNNGNTKETLQRVLEQEGGESGNVYTETAHRVLPGGGNSRTCSREWIVGVGRHSLFADAPATASNAQRANTLALVRGFVDRTDGLTMAMVRLALVGSGGGSSGGSSSGGYGGGSYGGSYGRDDANPYGLV